MKKYFPLVMVIVVGLIIAGHSSLTAYLPARLSEIGIAGCPTFYDELDILKENDIRVVYTGSTGESIALLSAGEVDMIISGRRLRPEEPELDHINFDDGYSFIGNDKFSINISDMSEFLFNTDLEKDTVLEDFPWIKKENLKEVDDPYTHLSTSIGITSFENTDYSYAEPVGIMNWNGRRIRKSRVPTLYFDNENREEAKKVISLIE